MTVLMLSLTGIPPTVGFFAKLFVLLATVDAGLVWLAVVIVLNAALAAFYYLRVVVYMYMRDPEPEPASIDTSPFGSVALAVSVAGVLALGIFPGAILRLLEVSRRACSERAMSPRRRALAGDAAAAAPAARRPSPDHRHEPRSGDVHDAAPTAACGRDAGRAGSSPRSARSAATCR